MGYVDYTFYQEEYYGAAVKEADFPHFEQKASAYVDDITFFRIRDHPERLGRDVKMAVCALMDELYRQEDVLNHGRASSFNNDGYSENLSYGRDSRSDTRRLRDIATQYLGNTGLLYRGVSVCD